MLSVECGEDGADAIAEDPLERRLPGIDEDDVGADLACGCGDLRADPAGTDHCQSEAGAKFIAQPDRVGHRSQVVQPVELDAGYVEQTWRASCRQDGGARGDGCAVVEVDLSGLGIESGHASVVDQLDVVVAVVGGVVRAGDQRRASHGQNRSRGGAPDEAVSRRGA